MEIPVINRISDFETGITSFQNPTFLSQIFSLSGIEKTHQAYTLWKWGALILALVASFTTIINKFKILILRFQTHPLLSSPSLLSTREDSDYGSETDTCSSYSSSEDREDEEVEEDERTSSSSSRNTWRCIDEDFSVRGSGHYIDDQWQDGNFRLQRRRNNSISDLLSWPDIVNGKSSVVKLWDNLGFGFGLSLYSNERRNVVSIYDMNKEQKISSILGESVAVCAPSHSPEVVVSADRTMSGNLLRVWDTRVGCRIPQILAEWRPMLGRIIGANLEKVYVRDAVTEGLTVGDMRKVTSPLVHLTESDADKWWDADTVW